MYLHALTSCVYNVVLCMQAVDYCLPVLLPELLNGVNTVGILHRKESALGHNAHVNEFEQKCNFVMIVC